MFANIKVPEATNHSMVSYEALETTAPEGVYADTESPHSRYLVFVDNHCGKIKRSVIYCTDGDLRISWDYSFHSKDREKLRFYKTNEVPSLTFRAR